jgi:hypothetical protein
MPISLTYYPESDIMHYADDAPPPSTVQSMYSGAFGKIRFSDTSLISPVKDHGS